MKQDVKTACKDFYSVIIRKNILKNIFHIMQWFISVYAILGENTALLEKGYDVNIPVIKYGFVLLRYFRGWGMEKMILAIGIGLIFYITKDSFVLKNRWIQGFCAFMAIGMIFGKSYYLYNSWDYIFNWWMQFVIAAFLMAGYYFLLIHFFALIITFLQKSPRLFRITAENKLETALFETHPFRVTFLASLLFLLPYIIAFFPGTLQCDALEQLWRYFGIIELNNHHPIMSTLLMGKCIDFGLWMFHSANLGFFLYTGGQCILQSLAIAYLMCLLKKLKTPISIRWFTLIYFLILPLFPMWAITFVKDTLYYIFTMFYVITLANILFDMQKHNTTPLWQIFVIAISIPGMVLTRNNGIYVIVLTSVILLFLYRGNWKFWILFLCIGLCTQSYVGKIYLPSHNIEEGEIGEALSIPLQQTARYILEYGDEITPEEEEILTPLFDVDLSVLGDSYYPEISDQVKKHFIAHPSREQLVSYFTVWFKQFCKHPDSYFQAFFNQTYGYFYPNRLAPQQDLFIFYFNGWEKWEDDYMTLEHPIESMTPRKFIENYCFTLSDMPVVSMIFSAGVQVYLLLGGLLYLIANKAGKQIALYIPSLCIFLICLVSPVNACIRYLFPVMAVMPLNIAWCFYAKDINII